MSRSLSSDLLSWVWGSMLAATYVQCKLGRGV